MREYYFQYNTGKTSLIIEEAQNRLENLTLSSQSDLEDFFTQFAIDISKSNIDKDSTGKLDLDNIEGGPFAAIIVQYQDKPIIIGVGANHVAFENDPSAHGEICAIRDASYRIGQSDLSDLVMFSSCECCPQCQATIAGSGISKVIYANSRFDAAAIGFSDEEQYRHMENIYSSISHIDEEENKEDITKQLGEHDAMIIDGNANIICWGDCDLESNDPTASLASMNAIKTACKQIGNFHLPEDYILVTRKIIHPSAFTTADWARIGRKRSKENPDDPGRDAFEKDPTKIIFIENEFEEIKVKDKAGNIKILHGAKDIIQDINSPIDNKNIVNTKRVNKEDILYQAKQAFVRWEKIINNNISLKY